MADNSFEIIEDVTLEKNQISRIADLMKQLLEKRYAETGGFLRGVHPKSHGCLNAKFEVLENIDKELQVGLFKKAGSVYDAVLRFSNADSLIRHDLLDGQNGSRGMAVKIIGVEGEVLYADNDLNAQDFLMINTEQFAFSNIADYLKLQEILLASNDSASHFFTPLESAPPTDTAKLKEFLRIKQSFDVVSMIKQLPVANPLEVAYFGAAPFLFGRDRAMRISVVPVVKPEQIVPANAGENYLREAVKSTMEKNIDIVFDVKIQVRGAWEENLHIEDATKFWPDTDYVDVARITIAAPQVSEAECEKLFFTPWHALAAHQPLGGINRLRKAAYIASAKRREAIRTSC